MQKQIKEELKTKPRYEINDLFEKFTTVRQKSTALCRTLENEDFSLQTIHGSEFTKMAPGAHQLVFGISLMTSGMNIPYTAWRSLIQIIPLPMSINYEADAFAR